MTILPYFYSVQSESETFLEVQTRLVYGCGRGEDLLSRVGEQSIWRIPGQRELLGNDAGRRGARQHGSDRTD